MRSVMPVVRAVRAGSIACIVLLLVYGFIVSLLSGIDGLQSQLRQYWYYITALAAGFGVQVGMYVYLRNAAAAQTSKGVVAVSGTTSTAAMISCCTHYLVNIIPVLGATGVVALVSQYQIELFWVGLASNAIGIAYIGRKIVLFKQVKNI